jgi:hypothetical protein
MIALLLALYLHRDPALVQLVYEAGGVDSVTVVECESNFNPQASRREPGGTSWGLFQLYDRYHEQYRFDLGKHIEAGAAFLAELKAQYPDFATAVAHYNGGKHPGAYSRAWGLKVAAKRGELRRVIWTQVYKGG